ncbi:hypothetical protein TEA_013687 [Camellia sinensis var. sinensis]|uniref:CID domain-containing protein n=1 Tax=Camellia sinensis var. sinensis TaxID=542762 RepID=A0A4S4DQ71_CAMSN|nr:hypothetical protein TEA_013687 [Camellia sinensis var. sinensis]
MSTSIRRTKLLNLLSIKDDTGGHRQSSIFQKRARQIVETWDKASSAAQREQRISFLYLANDILQNSRRKGSEFVNEFWKVLPAALKNVYESDDDHGKKAACRLKLAVGAMPEKIVTAFQSVHDENVTEEAALNKCKAAASLVGKMEKDVESTSAHGDQQGSILVDEIQEQENVLKECVRQLENAEATRSALVSQLKEAVQEQELKLELICTQLQVRSTILHF